MQLHIWGIFLPFFYSAVHFSLGRKGSSNDLAKSQAKRRWGSQRQDHTISTQYVLHLVDVPPHISAYRHHQVVNCNMWGLFPLLLEGYRQTVGRRNTWSRTPETYSTGNKSGKYADQSSIWTFHHPDIFCRRGRREVWHFRAGNVCCSGKRGVER